MHCDIRGGWLYPLVPYPLVCVLHVPKPEPLQSLSLSLSDICSCRLPLDRLLLLDIPRVVVVRSAGALVSRFCDRSRLHATRTRTAHSTAQPLRLALVSILLPFCLFLFAFSSYLPCFYGVALKCLALASRLASSSPSASITICFSCFICASSYSSPVSATSISARSPSPHSSAASSSSSPSPSLGLVRVSYSYNK